MALHLDDNGYLQDLGDWDEDTAHQLAQLESIQLTEEHWELIGLARRYYVEFDHAPAMRPLVKWVKEIAGPARETASTCTIYSLSVRPDNSRAYPDFQNLPSVCD